MSDDSDEWWAEVGLSGGDVAAICRVGHLGDLHKVWARVCKMRQEFGLVQGGDAWHQFRGKGIGSSEVGNLMRASDFSSPQSIYREKAGKKKANNGVTWGDNADTARGKNNEARVRQLYQDLYGWVVYPACVVHDEISWARASLDGLREDHQHVCEIKCPRSENFAVIKEMGQDAIDNDGKWAYWKLQLAYQCWIVGAKSGHLVVYDADGAGRISDRLVVLNYVPDKELETAMYERLNEFWTEYVLKGISPPRGW